MALDYDKLMATKVVDLAVSYDDSEAILYALSIGMGRDPLDLKELPYVYEQGDVFKTVPTLATILVPDMFPPGLGWDFGQVLHSEQRMQLYRPLPPKADILINKRVADVFDWGPRKGALFLFEAEARLASDDTVLFTLGCTVMARGDGGFGGPSGKGPKTAPSTAERPGLELRYFDARRSGIVVSTDGRSESIARRPGRCDQRGIRCPDLARHVQLWHRMSRRAEDDL